MIGIVSPSASFLDSLIFLLGDRFQVQPLSSLAEARAYMAAADRTQVTLIVDHFPPLGTTEHFCQEARPHCHALALLANETLPGSRVDELCQYAADAVLDKSSRRFIRDLEAWLLWHRSRRMAARTATRHGPARFPGVTPSA